MQLHSLGYADTPEKSRWMYRRRLGFTLCNGMFQAWFDLHGGYFNDPELMREAKALNQLAAEAALFPVSRNETYGRATSSRPILFLRIFCSLAMSETAVPLRGRSASLPTAVTTLGLATLGRTHRFWSVFVKVSDQILAISPHTPHRAWVFHMAPEFTGNCP